MAKEKIHGIKIEFSLEAENSKYKQTYIDNNFCCHSSATFSQHLGL